jgi:methenyltetrahydromethanopterin cyclohydrolase
MVMEENNVPWPSINARVKPMVEGLVDDAEALRLRVSRHGGARLVDAGIECHGGLEAGRRIAEICMGGLGHVGIQAHGEVDHWPWQLHVHSSHPVLACLGSQYAGWSLSHGEGKGAFQALGSGPGRALARKETLFDELGYQDEADSACFVLEVDRPPPEALVQRVADTCKVDPGDLTLILTPTRSLAGATQVVARVLEVALHKLHTLEFPLDRVVDGTGAAPLAPPAPDFLTAMGRTNDAILFAGQVHLYVTGGDDDARALAEAMPSSRSGDYGRPFAEILKACDFDFYQIDPLLFSPARVTVTALDSGRSFSAGRLDSAALDLSFGFGA